MTLIPHNSTIVEFSGETIAPQYCPINTEHKHTKFIGVGVILRKLQMIFQDDRTKSAIFAGRQEALVFKREKNIHFKLFSH